MIDIANSCVKYALKLGAQSAEAFAGNYDVLRVSISKGEVETGKRTIGSGVGVRAVIDGSIGFSYTSDISKLEKVVEEAIKFAKVGDKDPSFKSLPHPSEYPIVKGTFDNKIEELSIEDSLEFVQTMILAAKNVSPSIKVPVGEFISNKEEIFIANSEGIEATDKGTYVEASLNAMIKNSGEVSTAIEYFASRKFDLDPSLVGEKAASLALKSLNSKKIETQETQAILEPFAVTELLESIFIPALSAEAVQQNESIYKNKLGEQIVSPILTVVDDGTLGLKTSIFDGEGTPSKRTLIIENGILRSYLYDSYTAGKDGVESTGNAIRSSYATIPKIGPTNFIIQPKVSYEKLVSEVRDGILITGTIGAHTGNPISGDFSVETRNAFKIEKGEIVYPVKQIMLVGNIFELLKEVDGIGDNARQIDSVFSPSIRISKAKFVS
ncbi:MAG: TldD/PmbA family protein [Euryarchaeota archaeon]|nr:TldD/PmbA family protein [Euryarchaeota archaeon]